MGTPKHIEMKKVTLKKLQLHKKRITPLNSAQVYGGDDYTQNARCTFLPRYTEYCNTRLCTFAGCITSPDRCGDEATPV